MRRFALIELLVVIAIIAILAALLLPALTQARGKARSTTCIGHQKQVALAFFSYCDENDQFFPVANAVPRWTTHMLDYLGNDPAVLYCPADSHEGIAYKKDVRLVSYAMNWYASGALNWHSPFSGVRKTGSAKLEQVISPESTLASTDAVQLDDAYRYKPDNAGNGYFVVLPWHDPVFTIIPHTRHNTLVNGSHVDGHVATYSWDEITRQDDPAYSAEINKYELWSPIR